MRYANIAMKTKNVKTGSIENLTFKFSCRPCLNAEWKIKITEIRNQLFKLKNPFV